MGGYGIDQLNSGSFSSSHESIYSRNFSSEACRVPAYLSLIIWSYEEATKECEMRKDISTHKRTIVVIVNSTPTRVRAPPSMSVPTTKIVPDQIV